MPIPIPVGGLVSKGVSRVVMDRSLTEEQRRHRREEHIVVGVASGLVAGGVAVGSGYLLSAAYRKNLAAKRVWIANDTTLQQMFTLPGATAAVNARFNQASAMVVIERQPVTEARNLAPNANVAIVFTDETMLAAQVQGGLLNGAIKTVIYDYERWPKTPLAQQQDSGPFVERAATICHAAGLQLIAAPSPNIVLTVSPSSTSIYNDFLNLGLAGAAATYADGVVAQAQELESAQNTSAFTSWVQKFAVQAKAANPHVKVYTTLSGAPGGVPISQAAIYQMALSVAPFVDGYWLYIPITQASGTPPTTSAAAAAQAQAEFNLLSFLESL